MTTISVPKDVKAAEHVLWKIAVHNAYSGGIAARHLLRLAERLGYEDSIARVALWEMISDGRFALDDKLVIHAQVESPALETWYAYQPVKVSLERLGTLIKKELGIPWDATVLDVVQERNGDSILVTFAPARVIQK